MRNKIIFFSIFFLISIRIFCQHGGPLQGEKNKEVVNCSEIDTLYHFNDTINMVLKGNKKGTKFILISFFKGNIVRSVCDVIIVPFTHNSYEEDSLCINLHIRTFPKVLKHGKYVEYSEDYPKMKITQGRFKNGVREGKWKYYKKGKKVRTEIWIGGFLQ